MARIKQVNLDDEGNPESALLALDAKELLYLALLLGKQTGLTADEVLPNDGSEVSSAIYGVLVGQLFNCYYEDGVEDAKRETR